MLCKLRLLSLQLQSQGGHCWQDANTDDGDEKIMRNLVVNRKG